MPGPGRAPVACRPQGRPGITRSAPDRPRLAVLLLGLVAFAGAWADSFTGRVVAVLDGDTLEVLDAAQVRHRVRLAGIDAPESGQAFGTTAKAYLLSLAGGKQVRVLSLKQDRYGREIGKVIQDQDRDQRDLNLAMLREGLAWWYRKYAGEQSQVDRVLYEAAETKARAHGIGLWQDPDPVPPWEWRRAHQDTRGRR